MKIVQTALATALWASGASAAPNVDTEARIARAFSQLQPVLQVQGRTYAPESLATRMDAAKVPAVSIVFIDGGRIAWVGAFGVADVRTRGAATPSTLFQAASISKAIAASGALALAERGQLDLDAPVNVQLKSWHLPAMPSRSAPVTPRHLLTHTAGIGVHGFQGYPAGAPLPTTVQILEGVAPANSAPVKGEAEAGPNWRYSGGGFTLLELLMSDVAGEPFPALMQRLVLGPLGMNDSAFDQPLASARAQSAAAGHRADGTPIEGDHFVHPELAAAGLWSTPSDLARWAIAITQGFHDESSLPISPSSAQAMMTSGLGSWGLGVRLNGEGEWLEFSHGGSNQGFRTVLQMYPRKRQGLVIMTNGDNGQAVIDSIRMAVGREFGWPNSDPATLPVATVPRAELEQAVGEYSSLDFRLQVTLEGERLLARLPEGQQVELLPQGSDRYVVAEDGVKLEFERDASGAITSMRAGKQMTLVRLP